ncbi:Uncharacterised protein [Listeria innocua]|nr:Uncharacterised protein [Listeria innocua]
MYLKETLDQFTSINNILKLLKKVLALINIVSKNASRKKPLLHLTKEENIST